MKIDLFGDEKVFVCLEGYEYQPSALVRLLVKPIKLLTGQSTRIQLVLTDRKLHLYKETVVFWVIVSERSRQFIELKDLAGIAGLQTTSMFVFKAFNLAFLSGGAFFAGLNLRKASYQSMEDLVNKISLVLSSQREV